LFALDRAQSLFSIETRFFCVLYSAPLEWPMHMVGGVDLATLRKGDLAAKVAAKLGSPRSQGDAALNAVLDSVREALAGGDRVVLTGFGAFESRQVKQREVRAIRGKQAGERVTVPAHKRVGFTPGSDLATAVRGKK
jgi:DNA-binding protein HU-beta